MEHSLFEGNLVTTNRILYTPSPFARESLLNLQEAGSLQATKPHTSSRENLESYLLFVIEEGSGTLDYNGILYEITAGDCVFIDCRMPYSHCPDGNHLWKLHWTHFNGQFMQGIYDKFQERGGKPVFHPDRIDLFLHTIQEILHIAESAEPVRDMLINEKLSSLLTLSMKECSDFKVSGRTAIKRRDLQDVKDYLDSHFQEKISLDRLSEVFFINKFYLTRIFKEQYGCSINSYLQQKKITLAKQLLRFTDDGTEEICAKCGLDDANYFSRLFKKIEGVTPGQYRKMW